jgi:hypothetical protein
MAAMNDGEAGDIEAFSFIGPGLHQFSVADFDDNHGLRHVNRARASVVSAATGSSYAMPRKETAYQEARWPSIRSSVCGRAVRRNA